MTIRTPPFRIEHDDGSLKRLISLRKSAIAASEHALSMNGLPNCHLHVQWPCRLVATCAEPIEANGSI